MKTNPILSQKDLSELKSFLDEHPIKLGDHYIEIDQNDVVWMKNAKTHTPLVMMPLADYLELKRYIDDYVYEK